MTAITISFTVHDISFEADGSTSFDATAVVISPQDNGDSEASTPTVPFFPAAANNRGWEGVLRVTNHSDETGTVSILAVDDAGSDYGPVELSIDAGETKQVDSGDLEDGNASVGIGSVGPPSVGDWRLEIESDLRMEVTSYVRTSDGFMTPMHDTAPVGFSSAKKRRVVAFNSGSDQDQTSLLRLVNPGSEEAMVTIFPTDSLGVQGGRVRLSIAAGASETIESADLEEGGDFDGAFGDGTGMWQLEVWSDESVIAMSLLATSSGYVSNWSTTLGVSGGPDRATPPEVVITDESEVDIQWVGTFDGLFATYDVEAKYRDEETNLFSECFEFRGSATGSKIYEMTATASLDQNLSAGRVLEARYRYRDDSVLCSTGTVSSSWSHIGEALVPGDYSEGDGEPDLVVESVAVDNASPETGENFTLSVTVRNSGDGDSAATTLRYYRSSNATISTSDTEVGTESLSALTAGSDSDESITLSAPSSAGTYYYGACVDSVSNESDTGNNCSDGAEVEVAESSDSAVPDLVVESPMVDDNSLDAGESFVFSATVRNRGDGESESTTLRYYRSSNATISTSDTEVGTDSVSALAAGSDSDESITLTTPSSAGTYYYGACVDSVSTETSTDNNCSDDVAVEVSESDDGGDDDGSDSYCRDDDKIEPGGRCDIYSTSHSFDVDSNGRGCVRTGLLPLCAGESIRYRITVNDVQITLNADKNNDNSWTIDDVEPEP